jgi:8-oxo-dGTP pyrophosphatase MutT (NUDIX family)
VFVTESEEAPAWDANIRSAARLVVVDASGCVLLFRYARRVTGEPFWVTPGGGREGPETFAEAAVREATEELGIPAAEVAPLWCDIVRYPSGRLQHEIHFEVQRADLDFENSLPARNAEGVLETRWWSLDELEKTSTLVFPTDLAGRLRRSSHESGKPHVWRPVRGPRP